MTVRIRLRGRDWRWLGCFFLCSLAVIVTGRVAYDVDAFGPNTSRYVTALVWAISTVLSPLATALGVGALITEKGRKLLLHVIDSKRWRACVIGLSVALTVLFVTVTLLAHAPKNWVCTATQRSVEAPAPRRCPDESFARMRMFELRVTRAAEAPASVTAFPTLVARSHDRKRVSVALDSPLPLCGADGPDYPIKGESRLLLSSECGSDGTYTVRAWLCEKTPLDGGFAKAIVLEMLGTTKETLPCD